MHTYEIIHTARDTGALQQQQCSCSRTSNAVLSQNEASTVRDKPFPGSPGLCWVQKYPFFFSFLSFIIKTKINTESQIHFTSSE